MSKTRIRKVKQFTVYEDMWATRPSTRQPLLLTPEGSLCCLGFACLAGGVKPKQINGVGMPAYSRDVVETSWLVGNDGVGTKLACEAQRINDNDTTSKEEKKTALRKLFKKHGVSIHFVPKASKTFRSKIERVVS